MNLTNSMVSPGIDDHAVIPVGDTNSWGADYGVGAPGGGLVSSLSDLAVFFSTILSPSAQLSSNTTRAWSARSWLHDPSILTGSPFSAVGSPWEIYRAQNLVPRHPHTVDIYGKGGSANGYQAQVAVLDEYGVAIILLTAGGGGGACQNIYDAVLKTLVPVIDEIAREQAADNYVASFSSSYPNESESSGAVQRQRQRHDEQEVCVGMVDFNATVIQDEHSLILESVWRNGTDMLAAYIKLWSVTMGMYVPAVPKMARLFPTDVRAESVLNDTAYRGQGGSSSSSNGDVEVIVEDWRIDWSLEAAGTRSDMPGTGMGPDGASKDNCLGWTWVDWMYYGNEPMDRVVFIREKATGKVLGMEVPYLRSGMLYKAP
ncbi:uncharacterized protein B0I36DRAFT_338453 [Microdochium trichocladiopsis]|uniref:Beta-lactamase/transpeptidase-like protein n=1 Tax=Microdochium trichocladiopsis TaxID=1682393 RepID=A0A9P9BJ36_9PEZI|nr:uncharacterized protein B0I36DRAFT_338453 [Microdochium trichocladiopsis]KAH7014236.1 hypothetical protein B0I36DRAFT_338453 [Microdochium trichocladiopsis]